MAEQEFTVEELANEVWKPVDALKGIYDVSNLGRIRRVSKSRTRPAGILSPGTTKGYVRARLRMPGINRRFFVHRLVATAFIGERPDGYQVNHIDGRKANNRVDNLEYVTPQGNADHASAMGLLATGARSGKHTKPENSPRGDGHWARRTPEKVPRGSKSGLTHLTEADVAEIRTCVASGVSTRVIARRFQIGATTVWNIVRRKTWKHV